MRKRPQLKDQRFGKLIALTQVDKMKWNCLCDCGKTCTVDTYALLRGNTKSCGCFLSEFRKIPMAGRQFGQLIVIQEFGRGKSHTLWLCRCDCGNFKIINGKELRRGRTKSCGCLQKANAGRSKKVD